MDLVLVVYLVFIKLRILFFYFFDGFRILFEIVKVELIDYEDIVKFVDMEVIKKFRDNVLNFEYLK